MANTKLVLGFIAGAAIGAIAGILMAPDKGDATRKKIIDRSVDLKDSVKEGILDFIDKLQMGTDKEIAAEYPATPKMSNEI